MNFKIENKLKTLHEFFQDDRNLDYKEDQFSQTPRNGPLLFAYVNSELTFRYVLHYTISLKLSFIISPYFFQKIAIMAKC